MAGMFYSLKEAAQKLGKTEDQIKQLVKENKLREFRDGSNLLFKIEEVNALLAEGVGAEVDELALEELPAEEAPAGALEDTAAVAGEPLDEDMLKLDEEVGPAVEAAGQGEEAADLDLLAGLGEEEPVAGIEPIAEEAAAEPQPTEEDLFLAEELEQPAAEAPAAEESDAETPVADESEAPIADTAEGSSEEISLAAESTAEGSDITNMDTALTGQGVNVLGETDTDYNVTEDSMAETAGPAASAGASAEASLEEIEDDVNLDSFGSGSGLLDLSLQADDTSLGGILDEIYTAEGGEGEATPTEGEPVEAAGSGEGASFEEITAEAEHAPAEEEAAVPEPAAAMAAGMAPAYVEAVPDSQSNIFGILLFVPLFVLLYTVTAAVSAMRPEPVMPSIVSSVRTMIWYIMGVGIVLVVLVGAVVPLTVGRERAPKAPKAAKAEKPKKEKAAKAEKPAKEAAAAKPAKEKKGFSLFGKKKGKGAK